MIINYKDSVLINIIQEKNRYLGEVAINIKICKYVTTNIIIIRQLFQNFERFCKNKKVHF